MGKRAGGVLVFAAITACIVAPIASCLDATELVIDVTTNADCHIIGPQGALIHVGPRGEQPTTSVTTNACTLADGTTLADMGSIVVLPSGDIDSTVAIEVVASVDSTFKTADCLPAAPDKPCIYARREISFLPHARLDLPIELDALCAGIVCGDGFTCQKGECIPDTIDPHQCDGSCTPQSDGAVPDIVITKDVSVITDAPSTLDTGLDAPCLGKICNGQCTDVLTDNSNCGACGLDCTGGICTGGTCRLDVNTADSSTLTLTGTCLGIYNGSIYVSTTSGVAKVPLNGGSPAFATTAKAFTLATTPSALAWIEDGITETTIHDISSATYGQGFVGTPELMAMSSKAYVWSDYAKSNVWVQPQSGGSPTSYFQFQQGDIVPVATAATNVYWTTPSTGTLFWATSANVHTTLNVTSPGAVIVDDPTATQPTLYVVVNLNQVEKYDYKLTALSVVATSALTQLGAIAWDGTTIYANGITEIQKAQSKTMVTVAKGTNAVARCLAVDGNAVYWLEQGGGVFKHAK